MHFEKTEFVVGALCEAFSAGSLVRNVEYQRGAAWGLKQKQGLVDSIFRDYPLPSLFLEVRTRKGLGGNATELHEIIDGQQRILALVEYLKDDFALLDPYDNKLRLPLSLRAGGAPWAQKRFSSLSVELQNKFREYSVPVYLVRDVTNSDEVRDLFIRLQSGTALTRQQIRDAWPGQLGPRIEIWAGKLTKHPKYRFFESIDGRGIRDEEDDVQDAFVKHRTTCAQLCAILLARQGNPWVFPSIKAADLDALYHEYTQINDAKTAFEAIESVFDDVEGIVSRLTTKLTGRKKIPKGALLALAMHLQDLRRSPLFKLNSDAKMKLADAVSGSSAQNMRGSSSGVIKEYYERWRSNFSEGLGIQLDEKRLFDNTQKEAIRARDGALCAICKKGVDNDDAEYDHFPTPHRDGGKTVVENGRLVHKDCHPRGRPPADS